MEFSRPLERPLVMIVGPPLRVGPTIMMTAGRSAGRQNSITPSQIMLLLYCLTLYLIRKVFATFSTKEIPTSMLQRIFIEPRGTLENPSLVLWPRSWRNNDKVMLFMLFDSNFWKITVSEQYQRIPWSLQSTFSLKKLLAILLDNLKKSLPPFKTQKCTCPLSQKQRRYLPPCQNQNLSSPILKVSFPKT